MVDKWKGRWRDRRRVRKKDKGMERPVLFLLSCSCCPVLIILFWKSCSCCPVIHILAAPLWLPYPGFLFICSGCPVLVVCPDCPLSRLSCSVLSYSCFSVPAVRVIRLPSFSVWNSGWVPFITKKFLLLQKDKNKFFPFLSASCFQEKINYNIQMITLSSSQVINNSSRPSSW